VMAHQSVFFQVNEISSKSDGGSSNAKRKSWKQNDDYLKETVKFHKETTKELKIFQI
jgi:hypothetical protein